MKLPRDVINKAETAVNHLEDLYGLIEKEPSMVEDDIEKLVGSLQTESNDLARFVNKEL